MTPTGLEQPNDNTGKVGFQGEGGAESGARPTDPDLQAIIDAWPAQPEAIKAAMRAMIDAACAVH